MTETVPGHAEMDGLGEFKPCIFVNEEAGITEFISEDAAYISEPVFPGVYHYIDKYLAMDDRRVVGMAVWSATTIAAHGAGAVTDDMLDAAMKVFNESAYAYPTWRDHVRAMVKAALLAALRPDEAAGQAEAVTLPEIPDDDADFTPDLARKIIAIYQKMLAALRAELAAAQEAATWHEHNWKQERDIKLQCVDAKRAADAEVARLKDENKELVAGLEWYGEQARLARLIHSEGDAGRNALADDGGKRARSLTAAKGG